MEEQKDCVIIGAGLSGGILAWLLKRQRPNLNIVVCESKPEPDLNKTWSFHQFDIAEHFHLVQPLISKSWPSYSVHFTKFDRNLQSAYHSIRPIKLHHALQEALGTNYLCDSKIEKLSKDHVVLQNGQTIYSRCIIDARGDSHIKTALLGYQKFVGIHCTLKEPHGLTSPMLMDARISQTDGFRFMYVLPWTEQKLLIEDTRYSSSPHLDPEHDVEEISRYCESHSWSFKTIDEIEKGVLPIPLSRSFFSSTSELPKIGMLGGLFHPVTGYTFADSVRIAVKLLALDSLTSESVHKTLNAYKSERLGNRDYFLLLNRMMFNAAAPEKRVQIFERFYQLPTSLISNFYRGELNLWNRIRLLIGKPPVPVFKALKCLKDVA